MKILYIFIVVILLLSTFTIISDNARATVPITWNTTNDFNAGNLNDPGADYFNNNGTDQPMYSFITQPTAIYVSTVDKTFIVFQGGKNYLPTMMFYDHTRNIWSDPVIVNSSNPVAGDGHGAPSMLVDGNGYIHVFFGAHDSPIQYARSTYPYSISSWIHRPSPVTGTYPSAIQYGESIWLFFRNKPGPEEEEYTISNDGGLTWTAPTSLIQSSGSVANITYVFTKTAQNNRFYYIFSYRDGTAGQIRKNVYVGYLNLDNRNNYALNGVNLGMTVTDVEAKTYLKVHDSGKQNDWVSAMRVDPNGNPSVFYNEGNVTTGLWYLNFTQWNGNYWTHNQTIVTTDTSGNYADMIITSSSNIEAFIIRSGFRQVAGDDYSGDIERWEWNGTAWSYKSTIMTEEKSGRPVDHIALVKYGLPQFKLTFAQFGSTEDTVNNYTNLKLYAWGVNGLIRNKAILSNTPSVQTISQNPTVPINSFELANSKGDSLVWNTSKENYFWNFLETGDSNTPCVTNISNGKYSITYTGSTTGRRACTLRSSFGLTGDVDVRIKYNITELAHNVTQTWNPFLCLYTQEGFCASASHLPSIGDNGMMLRGRYQNNSIALFDIWDVNNGTLSQVGPETDILCNPCYIRLTRIGTTFTSYYSSNNGVSWVILASESRPTLIGKLFIHFGPQANDVKVGSVSMFFSNLNIASGTVDSYGWRDSGVWASPLVTYSSNFETISSINLVYSGASSSRYISSVSILDASNKVITQNLTHIISGSSLTVFMPLDDTIVYFLRNNFRVQILLIGDGGGSVVVNSVSIGVSHYTSELDRAVNVFYVLFFVAATVAFIIFALWVRKVRGLIG